MVQSDGWQERSISYTVVRSRRKTMALILRPDNQLEVRCGLTLPQVEIERFIGERSPGFGVKCWKTAVSPRFRPHMNKIS